ncbi:MAG: Rieske (2Fe-2S) protein, partial [Proteobacteria bacterium]|nr:Rieske (2Fe-2S) protein [Pseudomonadota bacterium]
MSRVEWIPVASLDDIEMNKVLPYVVNDLSLVIVRTQETLAAFVDVCSHQTVKLSEFGEIQQGVLICHAHGAAFNCSTG